MWFSLPLQGCACVRAAGGPGLVPYTRGGEGDGVGDADLGLEGV